MVENYIYFSLFFGLTGAVVMVFKKPLQRLFLKTLSRSIDFFYDIKYQYYADMPEVSEQYKSVKTQVHADVISVDHRDRYLIYKWSDGKHYITTASVAPLFTDDDTIENEDPDCECILFIDGIPKPASSKQKDIIMALAGPGQDFSVSKRPSLSELASILEVSVDKIIFNNSNHEEFIF